jgi:hypothetical protein
MARTPLPIVFTNPYFMDWIPMNDYYIQSVLAENTATGDKLSGIFTRLKKPIKIGDVIKFTVTGRDGYPSAAMERVIH